MRSRAARWGLGVFSIILAANLFQDRYLYWDSYLDLAAGRLIFHSGIPHHEVFTVAARGHRWVDQQWLAHLMTYVSWREGGYAGVATLSSAAVAAAFGLLAAMMISRAVHPQRAVLWTGVAYVVCLGNTVVRAQAFAYPLWVLLIWGLETEWHRPVLRRRCWLVIPLLMVWANVHGSVLLAAAIVACAAGVRAFSTFRTGRPAAGYAGLAAAAALTPLATPYGTQIVDYYHALIGNPVISQYIVEWSPPSFGNLFSLPVIALMLTTCAIGGYTAARASTDRWQLALVIFTGLVATQALRYAPWFAFTAAPFNAEQLARVQRPPHDLPRNLVRVAAAITAAALLVSAVQLARTSDVTFERLQPRAAMAAAARYAAAHPEARILADDTSSSALLWKYPSLDGRIAYDARLEQFSQAQLREWFRFMAVSGPGWQRATTGYQVLVVSRSDHPQLVGALLAMRDWRPIESDSSGIALVRSTA